MLILSHAEVLLKLTCSIVIGTSFQNMFAHKYGAQNDKGSNGVLMNGLKHNINT